MNTHRKRVAQPPAAIAARDRAIGFPAQRGEIPLTLMIHADRSLALTGRRAM
jgi:hypothetical protein